MEVRKTTIARALTRTKTIKAQMENIVNEIRKFSVWIDKEKHPLGEQLVTKDTAGLKKNLNQAREAMASKWQQYNDLSLELIKLQTAINRANLSAKITIGDKTYTVAEAQAIRNRIINSGIAGSVISGFGAAVREAEKARLQYNRQYDNVADESVKTAALADVLYLLPAESMEAYSRFITEFSVEFDATLNEVNAVTEITIE